MRSVFVHIVGATNDFVCEQLSAFSRRIDDYAWRFPKESEPHALEIGFYSNRDLELESEPDDLEVLREHFGQLPDLIVMVSVSGRIPGDIEVRQFVTFLLRQFRGAVWDAYSNHCWTLSEIESGHKVSGHPFFDYEGWYIEDQRNRRKALELPLMNLPPVPFGTETKIDIMWRQSEGRGADQIQNPANSIGVESEVYAWFKRRYPDGPRWTSSSFDCYRDAPLELRMIVSMDKIEGEIANGGLPQLLWNVFFHWRTVLADCESGYEIIGAIPQRDAIREFCALFERCEPACRDFIDRCLRNRDFSNFNQWCVHAIVLMQSENERLFYTNSGVEETRRKWMQKNEPRLLQLMADAANAR